ncbi:hypothetical protein [uncultured Tenacibaculum sp.]|uniref:hypothetical protein n=1 Tax=uncultured Tenacibaculum sp. TaxID=174713 RepID=UPI002629D769|nr:hypothetical protein [uncultured Tenacibaculum sp.]
MARTVKIEKTGNRTVVTTTIFGNSTTMYSSEKRTIKAHLDGVIVEPSSTEPAFSNFHFKIDELENNFGAKTAEELVLIFNDKGFFSGDDTGATSSGSEQNNKIKPLVFQNVPLMFNQTPTDAIAAYMNNYGKAIEVKEDEIAFIQATFVPVAPEGEQGQSLT